MNTQRTMINFLKKSLEIERTKVQKLREELELEITSAKIEKLLLQEEVEKFKQTAFKISKEYMHYVQDHPDSDDEDSDDEYIDMSCFCDPVTEDSDTDEE